MQSTRAILVAALLTIAGAACGSDQNLAERQEAVAEAGAEVMPFPLDETTHIFTDTQSGGRQDVVADDPTDEVTIDSIRDHLAEEAAKFQKGDFSDPEAIHGSARPVGAEYCVVAGHAAFRYSWMSPWQRVDLMTRRLAGSAWGEGSGGSGGTWLRERWGRCSL